MEMAVPPSTLSSDNKDDDSLDENEHKFLEARGQSTQAPIAIIGAGPAGLTCATFLTRLGYKCVTVYESSSYAGGLRYELP